MDIEFILDVVSERETGSNRMLSNAGNGSHTAVLPGSISRLPQLKVYSAAHRLAVIDITGTE